VKGLVLEMEHKKFPQKVGLKAEMKAGHLVRLMGCRLVIPRAEMKAWTSLLRDQLVLQNAIEMIGVDCNKKGVRVDGIRHHAFKEPSLGRTYEILVAMAFTC
jgi:hypothetical protein